MATSRSWRKSSSGNHSWAVPYADIMTVLFCAMMALAGRAITLASDQEATAGYHGKQAAPASLQLTTDTLFMSGSADLYEGPALTVLDKLAARVKSEKIYLKIEGHTDNQPVSAQSYFHSNWELSAARAISVVQYLEAKGVPKEYLSAVGYGESRPVNQNQTSEDRAKNRRVVIVLSETAP